MKKNWYDRLFILTLLVKGIDSLFELLGGMLLLFVKPSTIDRVIILLTQHELSEDPHDFFAKILLQLASHLSVRAEHFASFYLLFHGFLKVFLIVFLLFGHLWVFPVYLIFTAVFIVYQLYRISHTYSLFLTVLTFYDIGMSFLVWEKYKELKKMSIK